MMTKDEIKNLTDEQLQTTYDSVMDSMDEILEATKKSVTDILSMIKTAPLIVENIDVWNYRIIIHIDDNTNWNDRFTFSCKFTKLDGTVIKNAEFKMTSPYCTGDFNPLDENDKVARYYKTYGEIITNAEFLEKIKKIQYDFYQAIYPSYMLSGRLSSEQSVRAAKKQQAEEEEARQKLFSEYEEFLTDPANSEKWVAGFASERVDNKTGITYRNKPFTICKTVGGTWLFDNEQQIESIKFSYGGSDEDYENRKKFKYSTATQVRMLKSDKTGKWINRAK